jgi:hypothetical protein
MQQAWLGMPLLSSQAAEDNAAAAEECVLQLQRCRPAMQTTLSQLHINH